MVKNHDLLDADELVNNLYSKFKNDEEILKKAYLFASEGHLNQKRASGEPYITHPLQVATYLADLSMDIETVISAILHDLIEDTHITYKDIKNEFGHVPMSFYFIYYYYFYDSIIFLSWCL